MFCDAGDNSDMQMLERLHYSTCIVLKNTVSSVFYSASIFNRDRYNVGAVHFVFCVVVETSVFGNGENIQKYLNYIVFYCLTVQLIVIKFFNRLTALIDTNLSLN